MKIDRHAIVDFGKQLKDEVGKDDISGASAELAYRFFLAIFPFFIFLAALGGFAASIANVQNPTDEIMDMIGESLPEETSTLLRNQLEAVLDQQNAGLLSIGILGAIWAASAGFGALMKNLNRVFGVGESRKTPVRMAIALGLTLSSAVLLILAFVLLFVGQLYGPDIAAEIGLQDVAATLFSLVQWPMALALILLAVAFMYWLAPNAGLPLKWITPGAVFFSIVWLIATFGFGFYVSNFGSYNETYGALGGVVILLIWFYLTAFLLLLGAEINGILQSEAEEEPAGEAAPAEVARDGEQPQPQSARPAVPRPSGVAVAGVLSALALMTLIRSR